VYANWIVRSAQHLVSQYGVQIAAIIPETTERWDAGRPAVARNLRVGARSTVHPDQRHPSSAHWPG
jgi:uncharacterized membrane-anchored protein YjiN (DUF445 family)